MTEDAHQRNSATAAAQSSGIIILRVAELLQHKGASRVRETVIDRYYLALSGWHVRTKIPVAHAGRGRVASPRGVSPRCTHGRMSEQRGAEGEQRMCG